MTTTATTTHTVSAISPAAAEDHGIQLHREIVGIVQDKTGMNDRFANQLAAALVEGLRERYGGNTLGRKGTIYIPAPDKTARNTAIRAEFNGTNADAVCKKWGVSRSRLYQICSAKAG